MWHIAATANECVDVCTVVCVWGSRVVGAKPHALVLESSYAIARRSVHRATYITALYPSNARATHIALNEVWHMCDAMRCVFDCML